MNISELLEQARTAAQKAYPTLQVGKGVVTVSGFLFPVQAKLNATCVKSLQIAIDKDEDGMYTFSEMVSTKVPLGTALLTFFDETASLVKERERIQQLSVTPEEEPIRQAVLDDFDRVLSEQETK